MATRTLIRNIEQVTDIGDMPYELAEPFLKTVKNPKHLRALEVKCPQVADGDADIW
jgi:elongin-A